MRWFTPVLALVLIAALSGCGHGKRTTTTSAPSVSPAATRIKNRLTAHGYTATILKRKHSQPYEDAVTVTAVNFASTRAFNAVIYVFSTKASAEAHRKRLTPPTTNRSAIVGPDLFIATHYGGPVGCTFKNGKVHCAAQPNVPLAAFDKLVSAATARHEG